ncbi:hypothetical protein [uncultured Cetobacterium sp.]|uniref:hypothetical protein n=1 Tax=uncultured Cetobacterium sp. TaxID=527638 RepID=UPI0026052036|nr:hypothetical protein [uncultured Cetobacterium sp.]
MLKKMLILFLIITFSGCSSIKKSKWHSINKRNIYLNIEPGDILIKEKEFSIYGLFGHCGIMEDEDTVIDYPRIGQRGYKISLNYWLEMNRKILILRYKKMNNKFRKDLINNLKKYSFHNYAISFNKYNSHEFYCSQYVWFVFYKTAQENSFNLDIDKNGGLFVFPYDLINLDIFEIE